MNFDNFSKEVKRQINELSILQNKSDLDEKVSTIFSINWMPVGVPTISGVRVFVNDSEFFV